ncbi:DUF5810 domain-containing protein [Haloferax sp. S1W]|uniref:DUF5810 domain-containing protein n=1 Tax=Haloferax sp. S1W TaxID=3377110 RepID=UPI0037CA2180
MGYACPVCDAPQRDETHLANHLALQAIVHGDDHETWLDEHEPSWSSMNPDTLGPIVAENAEEREFDEVFEDTVDRQPAESPFDEGHDHTHSHDHGRQQLGGSSGEANLSGDAARIFEEAKAMTEEMYDDEDGDDEDGDDEATESNDDDEKES